MKHAVPLFALSAVLLVCAPPAAAQQEEDGRSLMEEGAQLFWDGLRRELGPALESLRDRADEMEPALRDFAERMGPALADLLEKIDDLSAYHPPEMLPNGDIILRRKTPQEMKDAAPEGEIEI
ncbi:hypothetical protein [Roseovarius nitratireducens]|uniref:hypothetical protein n=1 Tax=Roseovarius nitratireducens TaxID=2044597 RepID=UPI000CE22E3E|nr:hypothetical protein [Roseovarius nitratireducens]